jgi:hypothetical protein
MKLLYSGASEAGAGLEVRAEYSLLPSKSYVRKRLSVRQTGKVTHRRLMRADLDFWKGVSTSAAGWAVARSSGLGPDRLPRVRMRREAISRALSPTLRFKDKSQRVDFCRCQDEVTRSRMGLLMTGYVQGTSASVAGNSGEVVALEYF